MTKTVKQTIDNFAGVGNWVLTTKGKDSLLNETATKEGWRVGGYEGKWYKIAGEKRFFEVKKASAKMKEKHKVEWIVTV